jgi:hypothetical protein
VEGSRWILGGRKLLKRNIPIDNFGTVAYKLSFWARKNLIQPNFIEIPL